MTLEERYNAAPATTTAGKVRTLQASDVGGGKDGVNFLDGTGRTQTPAPDTVQTEFTRNAAGDFRYGAGKNPAMTNDKSYPLSRWLAKGVEKGDDYLTNARFTTIGDVRNAPGTTVHKYSPLTGKDFTTTLSVMSKSKVIGSPSGPAPSGLAG